MLNQFCGESRDCLQEIAQSLLKLEKTPLDGALMDNLFRNVHTLKGNSGLFDFPEMTRVLHAAEDLMSVVRDGTVRFDRASADQLLDAMDFVSLLLDEIGTGASGLARHAAASARLAESLRRLIGPPAREGSAPGAGAAAAPATLGADKGAGAVGQLLGAIPATQRAAWSAAADGGTPLHWLAYTPEPDCFFKGEDPFHQVRQTPEVLWRRISAPEPLAALAELDPYRCRLRFDLVTAAPRAALDELYRYVPEQVRIEALDAAALRGTDAGAATPPAAALPVACAASDTSLTAIAQAVVAAQMAALEVARDDATLRGRLEAIGATLAGCYRSTGRETLLPALEAAVAAARAAGNALPLSSWLAAQQPEPAAPTASTVASTVPSAAAPDARRAEESAATVVKVDQAKVDRLMSLIGEMVVAKNGLPFLAGRAETIHGCRELSREIKAQYAVINRIAEEMQDAIMQVRMMPVSGVLQRFPRLVRDIAHKLGKQVRLTLEGEDTEADKNIIEALADPLIHIVRNSLDHGLETPEARRAAGKPDEGTLVIRASRDSGRVHIDISDDGRGIDPALIRRKALEKGLIDAAALERIGDRAAIDLIFAAGFSTADTVSDLSGRGVGMDAVRTAVERVNGTVALQSVVGRGTDIRLSLPLSMAVTHVMVVESDRQIFGVPMELVRETVRVPLADVRSIKNRQTTVLRDRILPLRSLNELLSSAAPQRCNDDDELATLVVEIHGEPLGIVVDDFRSVADVILKPLSGILGAVPGYSGSALLGDGSVLMVLDPKELATWH